IRKRLWRTFLSTLRHGTRFTPIRLPCCSNARQQLQRRRASPGTRGIPKPAFSGQETPRPNISEPAFTWIILAAEPIACLQAAQPWSAAKRPADGPETWPEFEEYRL